MESCIYSSDDSEGGDDTTPLTPPSGASSHDIDLAEPRAGKPFRVCLTGGPCAGKSSALSVLRNRLQKCGFQVLCVPECATPLFEGTLIECGTAVLTDPIHAPTRLSAAWHVRT